MNPIPNLLYFIAVFFFFAISETLGQKVIWYQQPAQVWEEALPIGNGRLGAMVFGQTDSGRIQLNEDSLWPGGPDDWGPAEGKRADLDLIRKYLIEGDHNKADSLLVEKFSRKGITRSHQTLGDLWLELGHENIKDYRRELDLEQALVTINYTHNQYPVTQRIFASAPDNAIVIEISTADPKGLNGRIRLSRPDDEGHPTVKLSTPTQSSIQMDGEVTQRKGVIDSKPAPILHGVRFQSILLAENSDGKIWTGEEHLHLQNVTKLVLKFVTNTSYYHRDFRGENQKQLQALKGKSIDHLLKDHIRDYQFLFNRVAFSLGSETDDSDLPTDLRIDRVKKGHTDLVLETLLFDFGRYLLISSSRPGTLPANLQGLWNQHISAPWNADYHLNINLQMNYWPAEVTNLSELNGPLFDFTDGLIVNGKKTARETYGMNGAAFGHTTDLWQSTYLQAATAYWGGWIGAGGWMMQHYWEHFLFTRDTVFLEQRIFPALSEVAAFYSDWLIEDPKDGKLVSAPSTSPENRFINDRGESVASTMGAAMDQQIIAEVFDNYIQTCIILGTEPELLTTVREKRKQLRSGLQVGKDGRLMEWDKEYEEPEKGHRHMSHLYAFHPGNVITKSRTPELFDAVRRTLDYRLAHGGAGTGWSRAWLINFSARLMDGNMAHDHIRKLIEVSLYPNLFDAHPPFQIDGNFGYTAGIAEMLIQSHETGIIRLLPALPDTWPNGHIRGLMARGNFSVDMQWENGQLIKASIHAASESEVSVIYLQKEFDLKLRKGETYEINF